ncbi:hypothetical protein NMG60_11001651 [Bertholletia excelsa]
MTKGSSGCVGRCSFGLGCLVRRKQVDSGHLRRDGPQLAKILSVFDLISIGVGSTIGAGVYILIGTVAREDAGPALTISFLIAGIAAALSAFCYAELACRYPSAGSAYHYSYICVGEGVAWLIGWALILEYTIGGSAVARGISPNLALFLGGEDKLPAFLACHTVFNVVVDPCAAILIFIVTGLLCIGIKESSLAQAIVTTTNVSAMIFIVIGGTYLGFKTGWAGYALPTGYFPFGVDGMLTGSATVFFSYIGFDAVTSTAEEVKNPQKDLPLGIVVALGICCILYMLVSAVIVGLVPYYALNPDTPISSTFASYGMEWAVYVITVGAVTALCSSLLGSMLPQPRVLMAMARDGLLPSFFSDVNEHTHVPVKSTLVTGIFAAALAFFMDVSQLSGMVSVGTLLAFTAVSISLLILRYVPPDGVPLPTLLQESIDSGLLQFNSDAQEIDMENPKEGDGHGTEQYLHSDEETLIGKEVTLVEEKEIRRRKFASWNIIVVCTSILVITTAASAENLSSIPRFIFCGVGSAILMCGLIVLSCIDQDDARHGFGHTGDICARKGIPFPLVYSWDHFVKCSAMWLIRHGSSHTVEESGGYSWRGSTPFVIARILKSKVGYFGMLLKAGTWIRVSVWLLAGALVYIFYGRTHSSLMDAVYVFPSQMSHEISFSSRLSAGNMMSIMRQSKKNKKCKVIYILKK